jgi:hypothetical protein
MLNPPSLNEHHDDLSHLIDDSDIQNNNYLSIKNETKPTITNKNNNNNNSDESSLRARSLSDIKRDFELGDIMEFVHNGLEVRFR